MDDCDSSYLAKPEKTIFESDFKGLPTAWSEEGDIETLFLKYNECAKDQGFKMMKTTRKTHGGSEYLIMMCYIGKANSQVHTRKWKVGAGQV